MSGMRGEIVILQFSPVNHVVQAKYQEAVEGTLEPYMHDPVKPVSASIQGGTDDKHRQEVYLLGQPLDERPGEVILYMAEEPPENEPGAYIATRFTVVELQRQVSQDLEELAGRFL